MSHSPLSRPTAVITGASSGIGAAFANQLAAEGFRLILVARNQEKLRQLQEHLRQQYQAESEIMIADLSDTGQTRQLAEKIAGLENLEYMINNAGFGLGKRFPNADVEAETNMIRVHCEATVRLSHAAVQAMRPHKKGYIINVASMAAFLTGPGAADYCATKAFIRSFSHSIQADIQEHGIRVQALCPGFVRTNFHFAPTMFGSDVSGIPDFLWLKSDRVVRGSLRSLRRHRLRVTYIPSLRYKLAYYLITGPLGCLLIPLFGVRLKR
ncbi:MAG: SDR family NAD(P)-dependent oxidoreductase [Planctomycetaceae bacterium]|nr:SDR family NAD(P)-dependent oxidoreductase [Planctomycetaceae bacterium]